MLQTEVGAFAYISGLVSKDQTFLYLKRTMKWSGEPDGKWFRWPMSPSRRISIWSFCPMCRRTFWFKLEFPVAEIQSESKFNIFFLRYTGFAWACWKPWQEYDFLILNTVSVCPTKSPYSVYKDVHGLMSG